MSFVVAIAQALAYHLRSNWYILLFGIVLAVGINVYLDPAKLRAFLNRKAGASIPGAVAFGSLTPLCACGTMAVLVSMFATVMPWGAVMAFLISSPLTSPSDFMFQAAFLGSRFATAMLLTAIGLGLLGGFVAYALEKKTDFFKGQFRGQKEESSVAETASCCASAQVAAAAEACCDSAPPKDSCRTPIAETAVTCCTPIVETASSCCTPVVSEPESCSVQTTSTAPSACSPTTCGPKKTTSETLKLKELGRAFIDIGVKRILVYFVLFISIGTVVQMLIPNEWIYTMFGGDKAHSILLSALVGLPLYVSSSSALPLLGSFLSAGAGEGAILAFLIAGKGTSVPVMLGMSTFLKPKAIAAYAFFVFSGSIVAGYLYQFALAVLG